MVCAADCHTGRYSRLLCRACALSTFRRCLKSKRVRPGLVVVQQRDLAKIQFVGRGAVSSQEAARDVLRNAARNLTLAHDDEVRSVFPQMLDLVVGMRPGDDFKFGVCRPRLLDEITVLERVGNCADEPSRFGKVGSIQDFGLGPLPAIASMPRVRSLSTISPRSSMTSNGSP